MRLNIRTLDPPPDTPAQLRLMQRVAATLFVVGGLTSLTGVVITQSTPLGRAAQGSGAVILVLIGLVLMALPARRRAIEAAMLASIVLLGGSLALLNPVGMMPFFFLWPIVYAAYFCTTRMLIGAFSLMAVAAGGGIAASPHIATKLDTFEGTVISVGLMGALVALMQHRERALTRELENAARVDPVTGLLNRRALSAALETCVVDASTGGSALSLLMVDLDHFKQFNDRHGHLEGDAALKRLSAILVAESRPDDFVCRFGGEEFAIAMPSVDTTAALDYARRIAHHLAVEPVDESRRLSVSCGACEISLAERHSADALVARADEALYAAKSAGRRRAAWWTPDGMTVEPQHQDEMQAA